MNASERRKHILGAPVDFRTVRKSSENNRVIFRKDPCFSGKSRKTTGNNESLLTRDGQRKVVNSASTWRSAFEHAAKNASVLPLPVLLQGRADVHESDQKHRLGKADRSDLNDSEVKIFTVHIQPAKVRTHGQAKRSISLTAPRGFSCSDTARR